MQIDSREDSLAQVHWKSLFREIFPYQHVSVLKESNIYPSQLHEGEDYQELRKCFTINILNNAFLDFITLRYDRTGLNLIGDNEASMLEGARKAGICRGT